MNVSVAVDYWVIEPTGGLADPDRVAGIPGADGSDSPYSVRIETPPCETCGELRAVLLDRLEVAVTAAHDRGCRLLALGLRPDCCGEAPPVDGEQVPEAATAGTRIVFEPEPTAVVDWYNVLSALDPAFVLLNTTSRVDGRQQYACGRPSLSACERGVDPYRTAEGDLTVVDRPDERITDCDESADDGRFQPVRLIDGDRQIEWRSIDPATPTLLVDFIADVWTILRESTRYRIEVGSFGNGFHRDRLLLPAMEWRVRYTEEAIRRGLSSVLVSAYLERLGFETEWYRSATPPAVGRCSSAELATACRQRADLLDAEVGRRVLEAEPTGGNVPR